MAGKLLSSGSAAARWLEFYSHYFPAVEIDSTFYSAPAEATVRRWVEHTPAAFRFACKLPREITHARRLRDCRAELAAFLHAIEPLEAKLQVILIQLPPSFAPKDGRQALREFLEQLPRGFRFAIEFRHAGWHRPQVIRLLEKHRVCWVWADTSPLNERNLAPFEFLPAHDRLPLSAASRRLHHQIRSRRRASSSLRQTSLETRSSPRELGVKD